MTTSRVLIAVAVPIAIAASILGAGAIVVASIDEDTDLSD
jgi:hypothetical protein